jgi:hypothetical protein
MWAIVRGVTERDRLLERTRRLEAVLSALQDRAVYRQAEGGTTPAPMRRAIADFRVELRRLNRRLDHEPLRRA